MASDRLIQRAHSLWRMTQSSPHMVPPSPGEQVAPIWSVERTTDPPTMGECHTDIYAPLGITPYFNYNTYI